MGEERVALVIEQWATIVANQGFNIGRQHLILCSRSSNRHERTAIRDAKTDIRGAFPTPGREYSG